MEKILPCRCHKISSTGQLYTKLVQFSLKGQQGIQTKKGKKWIKLTGVVTKKGYVQCNIHKKVLRLNRLIAINFIPNPMAMPEVQHKNDIKTENRFENLKWGDAKSNAKDRDNNGHTKKGIQNANAKLNNQKVVQIRSLRSKMSLNQLAKKFKVSKKLILLVVQKKIWKHVK